MTPPDARMRPDPYPRRLWAAIDHGEFSTPEDTPYTFDTEEQARGFLGGMPGEVVEVEVRRVAPEPGGEGVDRLMPERCLRFARECVCCDQKAPGTVEVVAYLARLATGGGQK